ncbi:MFS transporter [Paucibacter soli]|uniref:MFS transporter n=1 Tax=Paucibacter soli TaxID=3133433 RepID=UPI0030AEC705
MLSHHSSARHWPTHPSVYLILILPFGVLSGFLTVTLAYWLTQAKVDAAEIGTLIALSYLPHTWKFLWAPSVDLTLSRKRWYMLSLVFTCAGMYAMGLLTHKHAPLPWLSAAVLLTNLASTFLGMAVEGLMANGTPDDAKGRAAGWFQAGNLGGLGIGGGAALWLAQDMHFSQAWASGLLAAACMLCALALLPIQERPRSAAAPNAGLRQHLKAVTLDVWGMARSRVGALALLACFLPIGSGAASNLWSVLAPDWHASPNTVALINGVGGGLISALGCLVGGFVCDRMDRKLAYCLFGLAQAACALSMGLASTNQSSYVVFTALYAFISGLTYAGFSAMVLEAIGHGAAATKYNLLAALSNLPVAWMTLFDGWVHQNWGARPMLYTEAAIGVSALLMLLALARIKTLTVRARP